MNLCERCGKRPAVLYVMKIENGESSREGLCLKCAREMKIMPEGMFSSMGISEENIDNVNSQIAEFMDNMTNLSPEESAANMQELFGGGNMQKFMEQYSGGAADEGGAATAPLGSLGNMFSGISDPQGSSRGQEDQKNRKRPEEKGAPRRPGAKGRKSMLDTYGTNLTERAAMGKVDKVINRTEEIDRVIQILNRRSKNNPVLLGEPGVGKTAIAEGLACRIFEQSVPPKLFGYQLYLLDFAAIVAGTQFRGQFEARLKALLNEAAQAGNVILVIDEIHNIVAAGDAEGAMSAANILKPALARGEIQIIGATTLSEYRKHIEKDSALERRFQPVLVDEPSKAESVEILKGIRGYYEDFHKVRISDRAIEDAVRLSDRYITERFLPDKAIDVIDEACSRVNLRNKGIYDTAVLEKELGELEKQMDEANENGDYEAHANMRVEELRLERELDEARAEAAKAEVTFDDLASVIESWTKIPVHRLSEDETHKLLHLEERIHQRVIGQDEAVNAVARAIRRGRADITTRKRPVSFIFAGPTGVGKTELVKTLAEVMFDTEDALIRVDMSEYMEQHSVAKLIGAPPGYVGYDDAGQLTEKVRRKPYSVILLDEIEKAHPEVFNLFLQILDDGRVADSHGKIVNFENTIIIMTTNAGSEIRTSALGFTADEGEQLSDRVDASLKRQFRPEFLNRIDEIVTFKQLTKDELRRIIDLLLKDISERLTQRGALFEITDAAREVVLEKGYDVKYGARPLKRAIQTLIEDPLSKLALEGQITEGAAVCADAEDGKITVSAVQRI